ncbi:kinase-like domain-containing protein [Amanita rubescens]|nr:kinase-like domain-containing protein [Amanita rubescens]
MNCFPMVTPDYISRGGFGLVVKGESGEVFVALKFLYKSAHHNSVDFCREALTWRSLGHKFVLPLLGIYEDQDASQLFLVSPYMKNGCGPGAMMLEVAQGIQYIHSEGVVHGDLRRIADFGLTRHLEATVTMSGALHHNFVAPELFGVEDDAEDDNMARTQQSDIYAFGCLYYEIHYDAVPFAGSKGFQVTRLVCRGERPPRLEVPSLGDGAWKLYFWVSFLAPATYVSVSEVYSWALDNSTGKQPLGFRSPQGQP